MMKRLKNSPTFWIVLIALSSPLVITGIAWQCNNPGGSDWAYWFNLDAAFQFRSLPQYQLP